MKGLYLYCIRNKDGKGLEAKGIDGKSKAMSIPYKDIEAIVSAVDLKEYSSKELARRAKEDLKWIIKHAQKHEKVIEHAMKIKGKIIPIIPMKFGTIFEKPQNLEDILKKEYQKFKKLLSSLTGKQEWSVKVYAKEPALEKKLRSSERHVRTRIKQVKNLPRGADYFGELEVKKELDNVMQKKTDELSKKFFKSLGAFALESRQNKVLAKEFAGHKEPMILNGAYLVSEGRMRDFVKEAKNLQSV